MRLGINKRLLYDFRSDTVTRPCAQMLQKMHDAPVGDDVMLSDPSVTLLQKRVAALTGMEDALFCASGTMSNQLAIAASVGGLCSVIGDKRSHVFKYEATAIAYHARNFISFRRENNRD